MPNPNRHPHFTTTHATVNHHPPPKRNPKLLSIFLKFIVMSLILSLFIIFLGLAVILSLHVLLAGSFLHWHRRQDTHTTPLPPSSSYSLLDLQNHLPGFRYSDGNSSDCSICLDCFKEDDSCRVLPACKHVFHAQCVDTWLTKVANCPVCRTPVRLEVDRPSDLGVSDEDCKFLWAIGVGRQVMVDY